METITTSFNLATIPTRQLKGIYCMLFNELASPHLPEPQKAEIRTAIKHVTAELQARHIL